MIVYCRSGRRSKLALEALRAQGFGKLSHLEGDFLAWEAAKRPVEREASEVPLQKPRQP